MMLIICDKNPELAVDYLIEHTNKNFAFKQLLELCQLLAGCGITKRMKPIKQGKELMTWILKNKEFTFLYFRQLFNWAKWNINMSVRTWEKFDKIEIDLYYSFGNTELEYPKTAVFRYKQGYKCNHESNAELPIDVAVDEYKKYIKWKFKESEE